MKRLLIIIALTVLLIGCITWHHWECECDGTYEQVKQCMDACNKNK